MIKNLLQPIGQIDLTILALYSAKELESPKLKLWREELICHIFDSDRSTNIDIDAGAGFFQYYTIQLGHTVHGIDITPNMTEAGVRKRQTTTNGIESR